MGASGKIVIIIGSDEEEEEHTSKRGGGGQSAYRLDLKRTEKKKIGKSGIKKELNDDGDDECVILDGDPDKPLRVVENESAAVLGSELDELVIVAEKGQVACRDYPHARHLCARFPFNTNPHEKYCSLCHCYVCDTSAPCDHWGRGMSSGDHCHATDKEEIWRLLRQCSKQGKTAQLPALNHPVSTPANAPTLPSTTGLSQSPSGGEGRAVTVGSIVTALDELTLQTDRLTGTVKWFDCRKGYGFISPDNGGEDLFVHHSSIKSVGYRSLSEGEEVEFRIESRDYGRKVAVEVTRLGLSFVQGNTTRGSDLIDARECYKCGETGHVARNCVVCYNCGKTGHLARNCSCTGSETDGKDSDGSDTSRHTNCGETGHLARNCVECYNCGKTGHLARNCSYTGSLTGGSDSNGNGTGRYNYCSDTCRCYVCEEGGHLARNCSHTRNGSDANDDSDIGRDDLWSDTHQNNYGETPHLASIDVNTRDCYNCGKTGHLARNCPCAGSESDNDDTQRGNVIIDTRDCYNCGKMGHLARNCPCMGSESDDSDTQRVGVIIDTRDCYNCGKTGHLARNCPCTGIESDDSDTQRGNVIIDTRDCYSCGKTGHLARNCPYTGSESEDNDNIDSDTRRVKYRGGTRGCYNCGRTGHLARNCSFSQSGNNDTDNNDSDTLEGDQLVVQAEILTGIVKWFSSEKGYGFITPEGEGEDLFVHQSSIKSKGYRSLAEGEVVEFQIGQGDDGRKKAVDVTGPGGSSVRGRPRRDKQKVSVDLIGPGGSFVRGTPRRDNHITDTHDFYNCEQTVHLLGGLILYE